MMSGNLINLLKEWKLVRDVYKAELAAEEVSSYNNFECCNSCLSQLILLRLVKSVMFLGSFAVG